MIKPKGYHRKPFSNDKYMVEIACRTLQETDKAVLLDAGLESPVWIPKSWLEDWPDKGQDGEMLLDERHAKNKGLI